MDLSVVMPVRGGASTIRAAVESLLAQDFEGTYEVIVVVDRDDASRDALVDLLGDHRLVILHPDPFPVPGARDSNWRRCAGVAASRGRQLAYVDADMVFPPDWARRAVARLDVVDCVAGTVRSVDGYGFWGRYVDRNTIAAKTPRFATRRLLTKASLGRRGCKPPITANFVFSRAVVETVGPPRPDVTYNYDDYAFCQEIVDAGFEILCDPDLAGSHHHRQGLRALINEYRSSGRGCGQFVRLYPHSVLARRRLRHLYTCVAAGVALVTALVFAPLAALVTVALVLGVLGLVQLVSLRSPEGTLYPAITGLLGSAFVCGFAYEHLFGEPVPVSWDEPIASVPRADREIVIDLVAEEVRETTDA
jgi:succinoglycan biosynthesis protein ExoA